MFSRHSNHSNAIRGMARAHSLTRTVLLLGLAVLAPGLTSCDSGSSGGGVAAPAATGFAEPNPVYTIGVPIAPNPLGVNTGGSPITAITVSPPLPAGLSIGLDGILVGTPSATQPSTVHSITVTTAGGDVTQTITITVTDPAPSGLSYPVGGVVAGLNIPLTPVVPMVSGPATFSITGTLPPGLVFDPATGTISGTPTALFPETVFTVTATNSGGSTSVDVAISVLGNPVVVGNARFVDGNANGIADVGDQIVLVFDQQITASGASLSDIALLVSGDSLGTAPTLSDGALGNEIVVELGDGALLNVRGVFDTANTTAGSASGIDFLNTSLLVRNPVTTLTAEPALGLDLQPGFGSGPTVIASNVTAIASRDFDRDGDIDIFALGATNRLLSNDGSAGFTAQMTVGLGAVVAIEAADLDLDGDEDLICAGPAGTAATALNDGNGNFTAATFRVGGSTAVESLDIDRDGDVDWILATAGGLMIMVNATNGAGGELLVPTVEAPTAIETVDIDRDGDVDVIAGFATADVEIFLNNGSGTLMSSSTLAVQGVTGLRAIDRDVDGAFDLVVATDQTVELFDGASSGTLSLTSTFSNLRDFVVAVDLDANGLVDLASGTSTGSSVLFSDAASNFTPLRQELPQAIGGDESDYDRDGDSDLVLIAPNGDLLLVRGSVTGARGDVTLVDLPDALDDEFGFGGALGDLDGDGDLDLIIARTDVDGSAPGCVLYRGNRNGEFTFGQVFAIGSSGDVGLIDADRDGDLDVFVAQRDRASELWINDGSGMLTSSGLVLPNNVSTSVAVGDLDRDGDQDIVIGNEGPNTVLLGDGSGGFSVGTDATMSAFTRDIVLADFDRDGDLDLFDGTSLGRFNRIYLNDGNGVFTQQPQIDISDIQSVAAGDIDRDGRLDLVFGLTLTGLVPAANQIYLGDGAGAFTLTTTFAETTATNAVDLVDIDGDGVLDLFEVGADGDTLRRGDGLGGFGPLEILPGGSAATTFSTCGDLDVDGDFDLVRFRIGATGTVTIDN